MHDSHVRQENRVKVTGESQVQVMYSFLILEYIGTRRMIFLVSKSPWKLPAIEMKSHGGGMADRRQIDEI